MFLCIKFEMKSLTHSENRQEFPKFTAGFMSTVTWWCAHVCRTVSYCFAMLRQLRSIRYLVSASVFQSLVTALVLCRLYYDNITLVGFPVYRQRRLQSVQNAAARLIFRLRRSDHITDALVSKLTTCASAHNLQGCHPDVPCSDGRRTTVPAAIRPCCRHAFSSQTSVLYFRRPDRTGCLTDLHRLSRFSVSGSSLASGIRY